MSDKYLTEHLRHLSLERKSAMTIYHRDRALTRLATAIGIPLIEATPEMLYEWRATLHVGDSTAADYLSHVKEFYRWAVRKSYVSESPAEDLPVPKIPRRLPRPITEADLMLALGTAAPRTRLWFVLAAYCGLRAKEIALLRVWAIRLRDPQPVIMVAADATKGRRERVIPLCDFAVRELEAYPLPATGLAFRNAAGRALQPWWVSKLCNEHLHQEGIASTLHCLRARFATAAYDVDHDILLVQELLGHASVTTTTVYTKHNQANAAATVNKLPVPRAS